METMLDYKFTYTIDGEPYDASNVDYPLADLGELESIASTLLGSWDENMQATLMAAIAPAICIGISCGKTMAERLGVRETRDDTSEVRFTVYTPDGRVLYCGDPVQLGCVVHPEADQPAVAVRPKDFTQGIMGAVGPDGHLSQAVKDKIDEVYPLAAELNEKLKSADPDDLRDMMLLSMSTIQAVTDVIRHHSD